MLMLKWLFGSSENTEKKIYTTKDLVLACENGDVKKVKGILDSIAESRDKMKIINGEYEYVSGPYTAFQIAFREACSTNYSINKFVAILILLIKAGAQRRENHFSHVDLLKWSIQNEQIDLLETLFEAGLELNVNLPYLVLAAYTDNSRLLRLLINHGASVNTTSRDFAETALHVACKRKSLACIEELLKAPGIDVNLPDYFFKRPLDYFLDAIKTGSQLGVLGTLDKLRAKGALSSEEIAKNAKLEEQVRLEEQEPPVSSRKRDRKPVKSEFAKEEPVSELKRERKDVKVSNVRIKP